MTKKPLLVLAIVTAAVLIYDGYLQATGGDAATISIAFMQSAKAYPVLPFLVGYLMGHLTWYNAGGQA